MTKIPSHLMPATVENFPKTVESIIEDNFKRAINKREDPFAPPRRMSEDMVKSGELIKNAVTAAHDDACTAVNKALQGVRDKMQGLEGAVAAHIKALQEEGQAIARRLDETMKELTKTVEWVESQGKRALPQEGNIQYDGGNNAG